MANQDTSPTLAFSITVAGDFVGKQEFEQEMVTIGKGAAAVLQVQDDQLADLHAAVQIGDDGEITVLDLGSDTGTLLNGNPVNNNKLSDGDEIKLGNSTIVVNLIQAVEEPEEDTDSVGDAVTQAVLSHSEAEAELNEAEDVMDFVLRSGTSESDIGIDRKGPKLLEVAEIWSGTVMNVKHFDEKVPAVYVGDRQTKPFRVLSGIFTSILVLGAVFFMAKGELLQSQWDNATVSLRVELDDAFKPAVDAAGKNYIQLSENKRFSVDPDAITYPGVPNHVSYIAKWQSELDAIKAAEREAIKAARVAEREDVAAEADRRMESDRALTRKIRKRVRAAKKEDPESTLTAEIAQDDIRNEMINEIENDRDKAKKEAEEALLPKDNYKEYREAWLEDTKVAFERAIKRNRDAAVVLVPPQFELFERPDFEAFIATEMLPAAQGYASKGKLPKDFIDEFGRFYKEYDRYDDLDERRVVEDLVLATRFFEAEGSCTAAAAGADVLMLVAGMDAAKIYYQGTDGDTQTIANESEVCVWDPTEAQIAERKDLYKEVQTVLYNNSRARRQSGSACKALVELIQFEDSKDNFEYNARYANCLANRNEYDKAREFAERALELKTSDDLKDKGDEDNYLIALQVKARIDLSDAFGTEETLEDGTVVWVSGDAASHGTAIASLERRVAAEATHSLLQDFALETSDPGALKVVDHSVTLLRKEALKGEQRDQARNAINLAFAILLVLPFGFGFDELRSRKMAQDFFVSSDNLPNDHFAIVEQSGKAVTVNFTTDSIGYLETAGERVSTADLISSGRATKSGKHFSLDLAEDDRFVNDLGHLVFFVHKVFRPKLVPSPFAQNIDWLFLGILSLLLFLGGGFGLTLLTRDYDPKREVVTIPDRFVELSVQQIEKEKEKKKPAGNKDAGEGAKAKDKEGKTGKKQHKLKKAKGSKVAIQKSQMDKQIAESTGLLADLNQMTDNSIFGTGGLDASIANVTGGLLGSQYGNQYGSGGLGSRGSGFGGGGTAAGLGGLGTRGTGLGASGYGRGSGFYGKKGGGAPGVGRGTPIILGALDKSLIDRVVKSHLAQIRFCYERELNKSPKLFGKIVVKFVIAKNGSVSSASTKASTMKNPIVEQCLNKRFLRMKFPSPKGGGIVIVSYPFVFNSQG